MVQKNVKTDVANSSATIESGLRFNYDIYQGVATLHHRSYDRYSADRQVGDESCNAAARHSVPPACQRKVAVNISMSNIHTTYKTVTSAIYSHLRKRNTRRENGRSAMVRMSAES